MAWRIPFSSSPLVSSLTLLFLLVPLIFVPIWQDAYGIPKLIAFTIGVGVALVFAFRPHVANMQIESNSPRHITLGWRLLVGFLVFCIVSTIFSKDIWYSIWGFDLRYTNGLLFYVLWAALIWLVAMVRVAHRWLAILTVWVGCVAGAYAFIQSAQVGYYQALTTIVARAPSFFGNANFAGTFMAAVFPLAIWYARKLYSEGHVAYALLPPIIIGAGLIGVSSRGALLGVAGALVVLVIVVRVKRLVSRRATLLVVLAGFCGLMVLGISIAKIRPQTLTDSWRFSEANIASRIWVWKLAATTISRYPVTGIGLGNFLLAYEDYARDSVGFVDMSTYDDAHNLFLHIGATAGLPAVILFIALYIYGLSLGFRGNSKELEGMYPFVAAGLLAWTIAALFTPVMVGEYVLAALFLGILLSRRGSPGLPHAVYARRIGQILGIVMIVAGGCLLVGEVAAYQGVRLYNRGNIPAAVKRLGLASILNPTNYVYRLYTAAARIHLDPQATEAAVHAYATVHPKYAQTVFWQGHLWYWKYRHTQSTEDAAQAALWFTAAARATPYAMHPQVSAVQAELGLGASPASVKARLHRMIVKDSESVEAWETLAYIYKQEENRSGFGYALARLLRLQPSHPIALAAIQQLQAGVALSDIPFVFQNRLGVF
jgi:O-antigen ligase